MIKKNNSVNMITLKILMIVVFMFISLIFIQ
jgi:hypothetical protein